MVEAPLPGEPRLCVLAHLTPAQRRAYVLADNKLALNAGWDLTRARARARRRRESKTWPADKVERWGIERLIPYAKNARVHTDAQVAAIAARG